MVGRAIVPGVGLRRQVWQVEAEGVERARGLTTRGRGVERRRDLPVVEQHLPRGCLHGCCRLRRLGRRAEVLLAAAVRIEIPGLAFDEARERVGTSRHCLRLECGSRPRARHLGRDNALDVRLERHDVDRLQGRAGRGDLDATSVALAAERERRSRGRNERERRRERNGSSVDENLEIGPKGNDPSRQRIGRAVCIPNREGSGGGDSKGHRGRGEQDAHGRHRARLERRSWVVEAKDVGERAACLGLSPCAVLAQADTVAVPGASENEDRAAGSRWRPTAPSFTTVAGHRGHRRSGRHESGRGNDCDDNKAVAHDVDLRWRLASWSLTVLGRARQALSRPEYCSS